jgi:hypothetical protein
MPPPFQFRVAISIYLKAFSALSESRNIEQSRKSAGRTRPALRYHRRLQEPTRSRLAGIDPPKCETQTTVAPLLRFTPILRTAVQALSGPLRSEERPRGKLLPTAVYSARSVRQRFKPSLLPLHRNCVTSIQARLARSRQPTPFGRLLLKSVSYHP